MSRSWWQRPKHYRKLVGLINTVAHEPHRLIFNPNAGLGSHNPRKKIITINPIGLGYPSPADRLLVRHSPSTKIHWQKMVTRGVVHHELAHVQFSGTKPRPLSLGWLWNTLEDERIERLLVQQNPQLVHLFDFLGDALLVSIEATDKLIAGCLTWRWQWDHPLSIEKFTPKGADQQLWDQEIKPLVESAWRAANSDEVTEIARQILSRLSIPENEPIDNLPYQGWPVSPSEGAPDDQNEDPEEDPDEDETQNEAPNEAKSPDLPSMSPMLRRLLREEEPTHYDPRPLLEEVEGFARDLAQALKTPSPVRFPRPHSSRGAFDLERALAGYQRPFNFRAKAATTRSTAILTLLDQSGSMYRAMPSVRAATMMLDRAVEIDEKAKLGIWGFGANKHPILHRPLVAGAYPSSRFCIANLIASGGTWLSDVFSLAVDQLSQQPENLKIMVLLTDADLALSDASCVKTAVSHLQKNGIYLQPIFIGKDLKAVRKNQEVFGHVMACTKLEQLLPQLRAWLQAILSRG